VFVLSFFSLIVLSLLIDVIPRAGIVYSAEKPAAERQYLPLIIQATNGEVNNKGQLEIEELTMGALNSGMIDNWTISLDHGDYVTVTVAPGALVNITLSVLDDTGVPIIDGQDLAPAGEVETIYGLYLTHPGLYQLYITAEPNDYTNYALMVLDSKSYSFIFKGSLRDSSPRSELLAGDTDHFWFFSASDGESINMSVTPSGQGDPYLELYGPDGARLLTIENTGNGETETLENYSILANGMYAIRVGEFDFAEMSYQIALSKT
jgi:hypothetical protein